MHIYRISVVVIELHLLPHGEQDGDDHENDGPTHELVFGVDAAIQLGEILQDFLLQVPPRGRHGDFHFKVDHARSHGLAAEFGVLVFNLAGESLFLGHTFHQGDVVDEIVSDHHLEGLSDDRRLLPRPEAVRGLQHLRQEGRPFEEFVHELLKANVDVLVQIGRERSGGDSFLCG